MREPVKLFGLQDDLRIAAKAPSPLETALLGGLATKTLKAFNVDRVGLISKIWFQIGDEYPDVSGNALATACALCNATVVQELLEAGADMFLSTAFSWSGGLFATQWQGPAVFACALAGRTDNLRVLAECKANLNGQQALINDEPRGTLLYEASLSGRVGIVKVLLEYGVSVDEITTHPDDPGIQFTPLHAVSRLGLIEIALLLIKAGAELDLRSHTDTSRPSRPLALAIENGQFQLVQLLVEGCADLWAVSHNDITIFDMLFEKGNTVLIASAAAGMKQLPETQLRRLELAQLIKLFQTQGQAGLHTVQALFVQRKVYLWQRAAQVEVKSAQVRKAVANQDNINVAIGPDRSVLQESFLSAKKSAAKFDIAFSQKLNLKEQQFLNELLPQMPDQPEFERVPIDIFQCVLPALHHNPRVLHALAHSPSNFLFDHPGCQAIVVLGWSEIRRLYIAMQGVHLLQALVFAWACGNLNAESPASERWVCLGPFLLLWLISVGFETSQILGYASIGKLRDYVSWTNVVDCLTLGLTLFDIIALDRSWDHLTDFDDGAELRFALAISGFLMWYKLLIGWRVNESVGPRMLPILVAAEDIFSFLSVVIFPLLGIAHFYYVLRLPDDLTGWQDVLLMYRLSLLNDFNLEELGAGDKDHSFTAGCLKGMFLLVTFGMATIMMNIFIGVLGETYSKANETRDRLFVRTRAEVVFTFALRLIGLHKLFGRCCRQFDSVAPLDGDRRWDYVWYCKKSKEVPKAMFVDDDAELDAGQKRLLAEVSNAMAQTACQVRELESLKDVIQGLARSVQGLTKRQSSWNASAGRVQGKMQERQTVKEFDEDDQLSVEQLEDMSV